MGAPAELPARVEIGTLFQPKKNAQLLMHFGSRAVHDLAGPIDQISSLLALFLRRYHGKMDGDADSLLTHIDAARLRLSNTRQCTAQVFPDCDCGVRTDAGRPERCLEIGGDCPMRSRSRRARRNFM